MISDWLRVRQRPNNEYASKEVYDIRTPFRWLNLNCMAHRLTISLKIARPGLIGLWQLAWHLCFFFRSLSQTGKNGENNDGSNWVLKQFLHGISDFCHARLEKPVCWECGLGHVLANVNISIGLSNDATHRSRIMAYFVPINCIECNVTFTIALCVICQRSG